MEEHHWSEIRDRATESFADTPGGQLEQEIIDHFIADPERVERTITRLIAAHHKKPFTSPWAVVRKDLTRRSQADVVASATAGRQKLIDRATTWIHNAGIYFESWDECATELFGDGATTPPLEYLTELEETTRDRPGRHLYHHLLQASIARTAQHGPQEVPPDTSAKLYTLRNDQNARDVLHAEWNRHRPRGIQAEAEHEAWNRTAAKAKETTCPNQATPSSTNSSEQPSSSSNPGPTTTTTPKDPVPAKPSPSTSPTDAATDSSAETQKAMHPGSQSPEPTADADDIPHFTPTGAKADNTQRGAPPQSQTSGAAR